jgi:hypothetical protein
VYEERDGGEYWRGRREEGEKKGRGRWRWQRSEARVSRETVTSVVASLA